jgi:hypothetical protein
MTQSVGGFLARACVHVSTASHPPAHAVPLCMQFQERKAAGQSLRRAVPQGRWEACTGHRQMAPVGPLAGIAKN